MLNNNVIRNEADALELLNRLSKLQSTSSFGDIKFEGWPSLKIKIIGADYDSSLKTNQLKALLKLQETVYYQYGLISGRDHKNLTKEEKNFLEIKVKVGKGSSDLLIELINFLNTLFSNGISSPEIAFCVITLGLSYSASQVSKQYFEYKKDQLKRKAENDEAERRLSLEQRQIDLIAKLATEKQKLSGQIVEKLTPLLKSTNDCMNTLSGCAPDSEDVFIDGRSTFEFRSILKEPNPRDHTANRENDSSFEKGKVYRLDKVAVVGVIDEGNGIYECEFKDLDTNEVLIWKEKRRNIADSLDHEIRMAFHSKHKIIEIKAEILKVFHGKNGGGVIKLIEIFGRKPRSFKGD